MTKLARLIKIRNEGPEDTEMGICSNADLSLEEMKLFFNWPEFSGHEYYPISSPYFTDPCDAYHQTPVESRWDPGHPYGAARLRLLDHMIAELEKETA